MIMIIIIIIIIVIVIVIIIILWAAALYRHRARELNVLSSFVILSEIRLKSIENLWKYRENQSWERPGG